ncbi:MAG: NarK/NasA family nitrate transporter [Gluconacetobacter diazotrophicus]|nr:NarK/NasA family nitrate transporter [Gluconacetobacter diazotrophicus]
MTTDRGFLRAGHAPTLFAAFLYFDLSFMVWVLLGPLGVAVAHDLHLSPAQKGFMVAVPTLAGAILRVVCGVLVDRFTPKQVGMAAQLLVMAGLAAFWAAHVRSYGGVLALGLVLGLAGASFAVALPLASRWYPPEHQGKALGIAGAGNSGTVLAALFAPALAAAFGWRNVVGLAAIPLLLAFAVFVLVAKDSPNRPPPKPAHAYAAVLRQGDAWWFMFFYAVTFGGFVGLASSLTIYFNDQYKVGAVSAGLCTAAVVFAGSMVRPLGGALADRIGGIRTLRIMYAVACVFFALIGAGLSSIVLAVPALVVAMLALGMGNGAVFQLVPQRFGREIGVMTGIVGMCGGLGGFYLSSSLGLSRGHFGSYGPAFGGFAALAGVAFVGLELAGRRWRRDWAGAGGVPVGV